MLACTLAGWVSAVPSLPAQVVESRAAEIEQARQEKTAGLKPEKVTETEAQLLRFKERKYLERFAAGYSGFRAKIGGMVTGGGFGFGPEYYRDLLWNGHLNFRASAQMSTRLYQKYEVQATLPRMAGERVYIDLLASHRDYRSIQYHGPGPDSPRVRTNYRLEDTSADSIIGFKPGKWMKFGASAGATTINIGPGKDRRFSSAEQLFTPQQAPGIDRQTDFFRSGVFAQFDYRNDTLGPKQGGNYVFQYNWLNDIKLNQFNFRRMDIDLQHFVGLFNRTRVIALRAKTILTETDNRQQVPFYMQPFLGGSDDLRGFRPFRFSDRNMMVLNGEYRWEIFSGLDGALFVDGGKVFARRGQLNFRDLEGSAGFGFRFNARNATFLRLDVGFSHEGFQVWFKFNDVFNQRPFGTTPGQPIY